VSNFIAGRLTGLQLIGRPHDEETKLCAAAALEQAAGSSAGPD
jgi:Asp-tRNA(Asn)/Glu-tRNA(Gln) amidotransferase A subunit family amidase